MWLAYFALLATFRSVGWSVELWAGVTAMSALVGFGLALFMVPPPIPHSADATAEAATQSAAQDARSQVDLR